MSEFILLQMWGVHDRLHIYPQCGMCCVLVYVAIALVVILINFLWVVSQLQSTEMHASDRRNQYLYHFVRNYDRTLTSLLKIVVRTPFKTLEKCMILGNRMF